MSRRVYTHTTIDSETFQVLESHWYDYDGPVNEAKKKPPSSMIAGNQAISSQLRGQGASDIAAGTSQVNQGISGVQAGADTEAAFQRDPTSNPLYKALYNTESSQLSDSYQNASANQRARANAAGFGYEQPITQGAQQQLDVQEASRLAQLPGQVEQQVAPQVAQGAEIAMQPGQAEIGAGEALQRTGTAEGQQAEGYQGQATGLESEYQQYLQKPSGIWGALGKIAPIAAAPFTGGASLVAPAINDASQGFNMDSSGYTPDLGAIDANQFAGMGFEGGGEPPVGQPAMVGEKGPELFVPQRKGRVVSNMGKQGFALRNALAQV